MSREFSFFQTAQSTKTSDSPTLCSQSMPPYIGQFRVLGLDTENVTPPLSQQPHQSRYYSTPFLPAAHSCRCRSTCEPRPLCPRRFVVVDLRRNAKPVLSTIGLTSGSLVGLPLEGPRHFLKLFATGIRWILRLARWFAKPQCHSNCTG